MSQTNYENLNEDIQPATSEDSSSGLEQLNFLGGQPDAPYFIENPFEIKKALKFTQAELARPRNLQLPIQILVTGLITSAFIVGAFLLAYKISTARPTIQAWSHSVDSAK